MNRNNSKRPTPFVGLALLILLGSCSSLGTESSSYSAPETSISRRKDSASFFPHGELTISSFLIKRQGRIIDTSRYKVWSVGDPILMEFYVDIFENGRLIYSGLVDKIPPTVTAKIASEILVQRKFLGVPFYGFEIGTPLSVESQKSAVLIGKSETLLTFRLQAPVPWDVIEVQVSQEETVEKITFVKDNSSLQEMRTFFSNVSSALDKKLFPRVTAIEEMNLLAAQTGKTHNAFQGTGNVKTYYGYDTEATLIASVITTITSFLKYQIWGYSPETLSAGFLSSNVANIVLNEDDKSRRVFLQVTGKRFYRLLNDSHSTALGNM